jgi:hypothetical protein
MPSIRIPLTAGLLGLVFLVACDLHPAAGQEAEVATTAETPRTGVALQVEQEPTERQLLRRELSALEDSLAIALENLETGRKQAALIGRELKRLESELEGLEGEEGYRGMRERFLRLKSSLLELTYRPFNLPPLPDSPDAPELEYWRRFFPEIGDEVVTRTRKEVFMIGRDVEIGVFEKVLGDVIVLGGGAEIHGSVGGNVVTVGHDIHVFSTGRVEGDAVTIGGSILQDPGGTIRGEWVDTSAFWPSQLLIFGGHPWTWFIIMLTGVVVLLAASLLTGLIAPKNVDRVERQVRTRFGTSFLIGLATEVLLPIVIILLIITIVGIPVAAILLPITLVGLLLLGFTGVAKAVGGMAEKRGLRLGGSSFALITVGVLILEAIPLLGRGLGLAPGLFNPITFSARALGGVVLFVAWTTGLGAALTTRFGTRTPGEQTNPKPAPAPVGSESTE